VGKAQQTLTIKPISAVILNCSRINENG